MGSTPLGIWESGNLHPLSWSPCWTLLRLHSSHTITLALPDLGSIFFLRVGMVVMVAFPEPGKNVTESLAGTSISETLFPGPLCQGGHKAVPRQALFLLLI